MKKEVGLWIDHREAVLVTITAEGENTTRLYSDIEVGAQYSGSSRSAGSQDAENMQNRKHTNNLGRHDDAINCMSFQIKNLLIPLSLFCMLILASCRLGTVIPAQPIKSATPTFNFLVPTLPPPTKTSVPVSSTDTPIPAITLLPTSTKSTTPTLTSTPTAKPTFTSTPNYTPTPTPRPCNAAAFVKDVTIPDGASFAPNADFVKIWRLENVGTCNWTDDYDLIHVDGNRMDGPSAISVPKTVRPGETVDLAVRLSAPQTSGDFQGFWMLRAPNGELFGVGDTADYRFWVFITVIETSGDFEYDFSVYHCSASWFSETGRVPCNDSSNSDDGFVRLLTSPELENRSENEPALWVHPNEKRYGWIEGIYPAYSVRYGDVFKAWVGCMAGYDLCNVTFYLAYQTDDGRIHILETWQEVYDQEVTEINLNLSDLAGRTVNFILGMEANTHNTKDAQGFWFVPRIERHAGGGGR